MRAKNDAYSVQAIVRTYASGAVLVGTNNRVRGFGIHWPSLVRQATFSGKN